MQVQSEHMSTHHPSPRMNRPLGSRVRNFECYFIYSYGFNHRDTKVSLSSHKPSVRQTGLRTAGDRYMNIDCKPCKWALANVWYLYIESSLR